MINRILHRLHQEGEAIRVGVVGAGKFGTDLITQVLKMRGMRVCAIADIKPDNIYGALSANGIDRRRIVPVETADAANQVISEGKFACMEDFVPLVESDLDVVVEVTGVPEAGAQTAYHAIMSGKHVVMVTVEADVTVGPILKALADRAEVVYSCAYGDQPGVVMELHEWADALGFEIVAAGRGTKRYPSDREGTPENTFERFGYSKSYVQGRRLNPQMYASFRDGTKAQIEMTCVANMTGLVPDARGMHEPSVSIPDLPKLFSLKEDGGILSRRGVVELANCVAEDGKSILENHIAVGVFLVIATDNKLILDEFSPNLHVGGGGRYAALYRPYHLCGMETPLSIARAALFGEPTGAPVGAPVAEVITVAKKDLKAGDVLDGSGGFNVYGLIERAEVAADEGLLPLGLSCGVRLKEAVVKGEAIRYSMVELREDSFLLKLRRLQDSHRW